MVNTVFALVMASEPSLLGYCGQRTRAECRRKMISQAAEWYRGIAATSSTPPMNTSSSAMSFCLSFIIATS